MVDLKTLEEQLKKAGCNFRFWGRSELRELQHILMEGENIAFGVNGRYSGGFALLCVTDRRILLIDRKPMYLTIEDVRFDMVAEVDYSYRLIDATIRVFTPNKSLIFTSWTQHKLRDLARYTQQRVMEIRQYYLAQQFTQESEQVSEPAKQSTASFTPMFAAPTTGAVQQAGRLSVGSAHLPSAVPLHNPYAQVPLISRHWARRKF